ncbi:MAG: hypothetical protein COB85_08140, partial [Bacteroidetes bacterium]
MKHLFTLVLLFAICLAGKGQEEKSLPTQLQYAWENDEFDKAKDLIPKVLSLPLDQLQKDLESYANTMNTVGMVFSYFEEYQKATTYFELARVKIKELRGDTGAYYGLYCYNLAMTLDVLGRYTEADPLYLVALPLLAVVWGQSSLEYTKAYYNLTIMYTEMGRYPEAEPMNRAVIYFFETILGKDNNDYWGAHNNLARIYEGAGMYDEAKIIFEECLKYYRKKSPEEDETLAIILNNTAELYRKLGNYGKAEEMYFESLEIVARTKDYDPIDSATTCSNLALLYVTTTQYSEAEAYFLKASSIYERQGLTEHPDYTNPLNNLGDLYRLMGRYNEASILLEKVIELREQTFGTEHQNYANAVNNLALVYFNVGYYKEAEELFLTAKGIYYRLLGDEHRFYGNCLNNLAVLYRLAGHPKEAEAFYDECLQITERALGKDHVKYALYLNGAGVLQSELGHFEKAISMITQALEIVRRKLGNKNYDYIDLTYNLAEVYRDAGIAKSAEKTYLLAMAGYVELIKYYFPTLSEKEKNAFYYTISFRFETFNSFVIERILDNPDGDNSHLIEAMFNYQLSTKSLLLSEVSNMRAKVSASKDSDLISLYNSWEEKQQNLALRYRLSADELVLNGIDLELLEKELNNIEKEMSKKIHLFEEGSRNNRTTWKDIQAQLKDGEVAIEMIRVDFYKREWTEKVYYVALGITNDSKTPGITLMENGAQLDTVFIEKNRNAIWRSQKDEDSYGVFWEPIKALVNGAASVYFSPDGVYHQMNLYTLLNPATGEYLIDEIEIKLQSTLKDLLKDSESEIKNKTAAIFGFPDYDFESESGVAGEFSDGDGLQRYGYESLMELPGTKVEAEAVRNIMKSNQYAVQLNLGVEASESALKNIEGPSILHIATHGFFLKNQLEKADMVMGVNAEKSNENPLLRSGLMFAGAAASARRVQANLDEEDGILSAYEAMLLNLENTELVVLSACETGLGEVRNGQGVYGLQRAFMVAGA